MFVKEIVEDNSTKSVTVLYSTRNLQLASMKKCVGSIYLLFKFILLLFFIL